MKSQYLPYRTRTDLLIIIIASLLGVAITAAFACGLPKKSVASEPPKSSTPVDTADWYKDEECRMVFFTVIEGLYRDGISQEVVDLVIGRVEANKLEHAFVFRCKLCHACYEAFAVYQRRPDFHGADGASTIGNREIPGEIIEAMRDGSPLQFDAAFASVVQPWIKAKLHALLESGEEPGVLIQKFAKLADEGNALIVGYRRCQACDAINAVAEKIAE